jgi:hypothetical protein
MKLAEQTTGFAMFPLHTRFSYLFVFAVHHVLVLLQLTMHNSLFAVASGIKPWKSVYSIPYHTINDWSR